MGRGQWLCIKKLDEAKSGVWPSEHEPDYALRREDFGLESVFVAPGTANENLVSDHLCSE
jgi:hypothetical protein